jgi:CBS domain containing-hemolysin-like protein
MAFVSMNRLKLRELADAGNRSAKTMLNLHERSHQFLITILMGNNIVNITATVIFTYLFQTRLGIENEWLITAVLAPFLLIFAETVPKDYGRLRSESFLLRYSFVLLQLSRLFYLPAFAVLKGMDFFLKNRGAKTRKSIFVNEEEFRSLIEESTRSGVVNPHEKRLIDTILDFEKIRVDSVMIPASKIPRVGIVGKVGEVKDIARRTHTRMVLVFEEIPEIIVGMIYVFDLLFEEDENQGLKNYLRSPIFLPRNTSIEKAFLTLQEKRQSFALITDVKREVIGAVPIEGLLVL